MMASVRITALLAAASLIGAAALTAMTTPATAQPETPADPAATVQWGQCSGSSDPAVQCATLQVPIDWSQPDGATTPLAIAKRAATGTSKGPLLVDPGGPGGSGVSEVLNPTPYLSPDVLANFDIIGFDPRGVGASNPIMCSPDVVPQDSYPVPTTQSEYDDLVAKTKALADSCRSTTGELADHVDSVSVAHDMDAIRQALGVDKISYYGISYGTLMGSAYAELFPEHLRAIVLDGTMDHSRDVHSFFVSEAQGVEDSFDQFIQWCNGAASCALHGQDVGAIWDKLMNEAAAGTLHDGTTTVTPVMMTGFASGYLYDADLVPHWSQLATAIAQLAGSGNAAPSITGAPARRWAFAAEAPFDFQAILCNDYDLHESSFAALQADLNLAQHVAPHLRLSALAWDAVSSCLGWPGAPVNPQHQLKVQGAPPVLLVNSVHDPATPYAWALSNAEQLGDAGRLLTYSGWGHSAFMRNDCTRAAVQGYLDDPAAPLQNTTCSATMPTS